MYYNLCLPLQVLVRNLMPTKFIFHATYLIAQFDRKINNKNYCNNAINNNNNYNKKLNKNKNNNNNNNNINLRMAIIFMIISSN